LKVWKNSTNIGCRAHFILIKMKIKFENIIYLVEYRICPQCESEITYNTSHCKKCKPKANKFNFKNTQLVKIGPGK
jgi:predicted amidophosphoribosyltransferase